MKYSLIKGKEKRNVIRVTLNELRKILKKYKND